MGTERKRKVSLFDVVDDSVSKMAKSNGGANNSVTNSLINRWNARPYSQRYFEILEKRKTLPVWHQKEEFLQVLKDNQTLILVGETGSGKTTQVSLSLIFFLGVFFTYWNHVLYGFFFHLGALVLQLTMIDMLSRFLFVCLLSNL